MRKLPSLLLLATVHACTRGESVATIDAPAHPLPATLSVEQPDPVWLIGQPVRVDANWNDGCQKGLLCPDDGQELFTIASQTCDGCRLAVIGEGPYIGHATTTVTAQRVGDNSITLALRSENTGVVETLSHRFRADKAVAIDMDCRVGPPGEGGRNPCGATRSPQDAVYLYMRVTTSNGITLPFSSRRIPTSSTPPLEWATSEFRDLPGTITQLTYRWTSPDGTELSNTTAIPPLE